MTADRHEDALVPRRTADDGRVLRTMAQQRLVLAPWLAVVLWLLVALLVLASGRTLVQTWWLGSDFQPSMRSMLAIVNGEPLDPAFVYPPGLLILLLPLALFQSGRQAELIAVALEVLGLVVTVCVMARIFAVRIWRSATVVALAFVLALSSQLLYALQLGNLNLILIPGAALFYLLALSGRWTAAAIVLGLSFAVKPVLLPLAVILVAARRPVALAISLLVPALLSAAALLLSTDPSGVVRHIASAILGGGMQQENVNISGIAQIWGAPTVLTVVARLAVFSLVPVIGMLLWRARMPTEDRWIWTTMVLMDGMLLCLLFAHSFYALTFLPLAFVAVRAPGRLSSWILAISLVLCWLPRVPGQPPLDTQTASTLIFLGMVGVLLAAGSAILETRSREMPRGMGAPRGASRSSTSVSGAAVSPSASTHHKAAEEGQPDTGEPDHHQ